MSGNVGKIRNIVFVMVIAVCLLSVIGYRVVVALTSLEAPEKSELEGREYEEFPTLSEETLVSGDFQDDFESYVADAIPVRNSVLLANASAQRAVIELANLPFGYEAYPTFLGAEYVYVPADGAVYEKPVAASTVDSDELGESAEAYNELVENNADLDWVMVMPDRSRTSLANPAHDLASNMADYDYYRRCFLDKITDACEVIDGSYTDTETFQEDYYKTDHHWRIQGATKMYTRIVEAFGKDAIEFGDVYEVYSGPFWGSAARSGLCACGDGDAVYDVDYDMGTLSVTVDGEESDVGFLDDKYENGFTTYEKKERFTNCYGNYFHKDVGLIEIENEDIEDGETLLIIGDSFTNCMERFYAENYKYVYVIDLRHYEDGDIQTFIDEHDIDDALICLSSADVNRVARSL